MPFSIKKIYSDSLFSMGILFIIFFLLLLVSFCAYSINDFLLLNISKVAFFIYGVVIWLFLDAITVWLIILSSTLYFTVIPGINPNAGAALFAMTCVVNFVLFLNNRKLIRLETMESGLHTAITKKQRAKQMEEENLKNLMGKILRLGRLKNMSEKVPKGYDKQDIIDYVMSYTAQIIGKGSLIRLYLLEPDMKTLSVNAEKWFVSNKCVFPEHDCISRFILNKGLPVLTGNAPDDDNFNLPADFPFKSIIAVPVMDIERVYGIIRIDSYGENVFTLSEQKSLINIAQLAALALNNARLYRLKLKLAVTDSLTGLKTHAFYKDYLHKSAKQKEPFCVIFIDVDDFKQINDSYGHVVGDKVLIYISKKIKEADADISARYGGEEFALIKKGFNIKQGVELAEQIRKNIENLNIEIRREKLNVTVSIGVAAYPESAETAESIMIKVDHAMYVAKKRGKNCVEAVL